MNISNPAAHATSLASYRKLADGRFPIPGQCRDCKEGRRIGEGFHTAFGKPHAEVETLASCTDREATFCYSGTLCSSWQNSPCTGHHKNGINKVVIATLDPLER